MTLILVLIFAAVVFAVVMDLTDRGRTPPRGSDPRIDGQAGIAPAPGLRERTSAAGTWMAVADGVAVPAAGAAAMAAQVLLGAAASDSRNVVRRVTFEPDCRLEC